ncbi:MAG: ACT domain-containing protein [Clostridia bacterium]|nr:ACT domain-containing protein [Clostridia bacterium]
MNIHQISIFLENRAGQLAQVTRVLADHGIDMRAISIAETSDYGVLRMIVDDAEKATAILLENGYILSMTPVTVIAVPDQAGGLAPVLEALAEGNMDVEYMYSLFTHKEGMAYMVFRIADEEKFAELLAAHGVILADKEELGLK